MRWIARFGWLRARELGSLLWPKAASAAKKSLPDDAKAQNQRIMANAVIKRLQDQRLIIQRALPKLAGNAIVLSAKGARLLNTYQIKARPGDSWGRAQDRTWTAPSQWQHELLTAIILVRAVYYGYDIKTELELRSDNPGQTKYPDGLIRSVLTDRTPHLILTQWLEVESADKSGAKLQRLTSYLLKVQRGEAPTLSGWTANAAVVAFRDDMLAPSGNRIDHLNRISSAVQRHIGADLPFYVQRLTIKKKSAFHVEDIEPEPHVIHPYDLHDDALRLGTTAFSKNRHNQFVNHRYDIYGHLWTLKVYKATEGYRYEIWDLPEPHSQDQAPYLSHHVSHLETGFKVAISEWLNKCYRQGSKRAKAAVSCAT